jgi:dCTP deaminase
MGILSDSRILRELRKGNIIIKPFKRICLGSNSYDIHLGKFIRIYKEKIIDSKKDNSTEIVEIPKEGFILEPDKFYLASTLEYTETKNFVPFLEGKSSTGRLGISIHETAGKGDAGFKGYWTLEIKAGKKVKIYPGMPIGQIMYHKIEGKILNPYNKKRNAKYSNQGSMPVSSMMWKNFGKDPFWK